MAVLQLSNFINQSVPMVEKDGTISQQWFIALNNFVSQAQGALPTSGDISGNLPALTVTGINTSPLGTTTPTVGNLLVPDGTKWNSVALSGPVSINAMGQTSVSGAASGSNVINVGGALTGGGMVSTNPTITAVVALDSDQTTGTSSTTVVTPSNQQYHPSAAKFWTTIASGSPAAPIESYNVSSISLLNGTLYTCTINLTTPFVDANWACVATTRSPTNYTLPIVSAISAGSVTLTMWSVQLGSLSQSWQELYVVGYGNQ